MPFQRWTLDQRCCFQIFELTHSVKPIQLLKKIFTVGIHGQGGQEYLSDVHRKSLGLLGI